MSVLTLLVEAVDARDRGGLVVAAQDEDLLGVLYLKGEEQADGLDALSPSIHIISQEEIARLGRQPAVFEESKHVVVLSVDVSADLDGCAHLQQHGLLKKDGLDNPNQTEYLMLLQSD